jgi:hypothetical protein
LEEPVTEPRSIPKPRPKAVPKTGPKVASKPSQKSKVPFTNKELFEQKLRIRFSIRDLQKDYPDTEFPEPEEDASLEELESTYTEYVRYIKVNDSTDTYRYMLIFSWVIIELVLTQLLDLNCGGYALLQLKKMNSYENALSRMGENSVKTGGSSRSPELTLIISSAITMVMFMLMKWLSSYIGDSASENVMDKILPYLVGGPPGSRPGTSTSIPKNKASGIAETVSDATGGTGDISNAVKTLGKIFGGA